MRSTLNVKSPGSRLIPNHIQLIQIISSQQTRHRQQKDVRFCLSPPLRLSPEVYSSDTSKTKRYYSSWIKSLYTGFGGNGVGRIRCRSGDNKELGETLIIRQEGLETHEVPIAVLKGDGNNGCEDEQGNDAGKSPPEKSYIQLDAREEKAFVEGFNNFNTPQQILKMLDTVPTQEVTPFVSLAIMKKLFELENNFLFRNDGLPWTVSSDNMITDTFARTAIVTRLIDTIITSEDANILLAALKALKSERPMDNGSNYREKLFKEILFRVTKGQFTMNQVCEAIISLGKIEKDTGHSIPNSLIDKLWTGIFDKSNDIDVQNIGLLFQVLPYFKKSQRLVLNLAEKKLLSLWWKMDTKTVGKICEILVQEKASKSHTNSTNKTPGTDALVVSSRVLSALSRCINLNMHHVTELELFTIVTTFQAQNFCDTTFEKALNKYMKAKCLKISDPKVVAAVLDYAKTFHIRSPNILEAAAEFIVLNKASPLLSPPHITSIITAFGHLDFQPPNGVRFWQIIESYLNEKFIQFPPKDIIEVFLACVTLMKFPLNFVDRVFSPYFLDRVHTSEQDYDRLQNLRSKLKLLDTSLTIECPTKYHGPMLPKDFTAKSVFIEGRILGMGNWLSDVVREVLGVRSMVVEKFVVLPSLPLNAIYIADLLISNVRGSDSERHNHLKNKIASRLNSGITDKSQQSDFTIVLIHIPEHYSRGGESNLIGSQAMRVRHLSSFFNVASLSYTKISELKVHPSALREYIKEELLNSGYNNF